jgi:hypothetical protein
MLDSQWHVYQFVFTEVKFEFRSIADFERTVR